jgi:hypothetical protein
MSGMDSQKESTVFPDKEFLLRELDGDHRFPTPDIHITDEYSIPSTKQDQPRPLYYAAEVKGWFDAAGASVYDYVSGYIDTPIVKPKNFSEYMSPKPNELLYLGTKIRITKMDGSAIGDKQAFKIKLIQQEGVDVPQNAYRLVVYTNFRGSSSETYLIRYEKYNQDGTHSSDTTEILNAYPFFSSIEKATIQSLLDAPKIDQEWNPALDQKSFAIEETSTGDYQVYAPSRVIIADENGARPSEQFKYRITALLESKFNEYTVGKLRIGVMNLNMSTPNVEDLTGVIKKLYESPTRPAYLEFENPHPPEGMPNKNYPEYWKVDLSIHPELLSDYDLILLPGYGTYDMSDYTDAIRNYLAGGGRIWIDNNGTGVTSLQLTNFLTNVQFSNVDRSLGDKKMGLRIGEAAHALGRYHYISDTNINTGFTGVNPRIIYGAGETSDGWEQIVQYSNGEGSLITKPSQGKGRIFASNCGVARAVLHDSASGLETTKIMMNILLSAAERKWIQTPWLYDYVFHKENLFTEEYQQGVHRLYFDDKNDLNAQEIVAKKIISKTVKSAIVPYIEREHYNAKGLFKIELDSSNVQFIANSDLEAGNSAGTSQWIVTTTDAIPGWKASVNGDGYLGHVSDMAQRGVKSIKIAAPTTGVGSQLFWSQKKQINETGSYELSTWVKTTNVSGVSTTGLTIAIYVDNQKRAISSPLVGTQDWQKVSVTFGVTEPKEFEFRFGFTDGLGLGTAWCDDVKLLKHGSVYMTPEGDGSKPLYAYSVKPSHNGFNFQAEGFTRSDITVYDRYVEAMIRIKSFTYSWSNAENKYVKTYSELTSRMNVSIRKSDGVVNLGLATTLLPGLSEGQEWADKDKVFYEFSIESANEGNPNDHLFVNGGFFNTETGRFTKERGGKHILAHNEVYSPQNEESANQFIVQVWTSYTTIRATKRRYSILLDYKNQVSLAHPATIDERDSWYLRIKNGRFTIRQMDHERFIRYYKGRAFYDTKGYWNHHSYSLPEYDRQLFYGSKGIKRVQEETAEYINDTTIRVQNTPLYVSVNQYNREPSKKILDSKYTDGKTRYYKLPAGNILKTKPVNVFVKAIGSNEFTEYLDQFDVDYENGFIIFAQGIDAEVEVTFERQNLQVFRRRYENNTVVEEQLVSYDNKTYISPHQNWLANPTVRIYKQGIEGKEIVPVTSYSVDYDSGAIAFHEETSGPVFGSYTYSLNENIRVRDYDIQNGFIHLEKPISFKDEVYVNYLFEEQYLEYRGYYDEAERRFIKLDLNPSEGHLCTVRTVQYDSRDGKIIVFDDVPTARLMNKEVYLYMLPYKQGSQVINQHTVRHCFNRREWELLAQTNPHAILLGVVHVREHAKVKDVTVMDARTRGGGLREDITKQQIDTKSPVSTNYWDIGTFDGIAYYANGVLLIELPKSILAKNGGQFSQKEVNDIIRKYVAYGIHYNIEYVEALG